MASDPKEPQGLNPSSSGKKRIQTQIHRRKKAKAVPPLTNEWDDLSPSPPKLKTPSSKMKKTSAS